MGIIITEVHLKITPKVLMGNDITWRAFRICKIFFNPYIYTII